MNIFETLAGYFQFPFVRYALIAGVLIALCSSLLGVTLVLKRFSFIGDGLSHVAFGAMAIATVVNVSNDMLIVVPVTILSAILLLRKNGTKNVRGDAALASSVGDLNRILSRLMSVEALLATGQSGSDKVAPLDPGTVVWLEERIDAMQEALKPIDKFTIPGGNVVVSMCHVCRTVCRRAERAALRADARYGVDSTVLAWLNRLSDYFYLLGRTLTAHYAVDEVLWIP